MADSPHDKKSETPRTDAKVFSLRDGTDYNSGPNWGRPFMRSVVRADFARQLERELAEAKHDLSNCIDGAGKMMRRFNQSATPASDKKDELTVALLTDKQLLEIYDGGCYGALSPVSGSGEDEHIAGLRAVVEALNVPRSTPSANTPKWEPIETAPKTGPVEHLLLYVPSLHGTGGPVIAHWAHGGGEDQPAFGPAWFFWSGYDFRELAEKPSHWMRLPHCPADWRRDQSQYVQHEDKEKS